MEHIDDGILLRQFVTSRDGDAFAALVRRYIDLVYSAARRQSDDAAAAEDVTQSVFILLAQRAHTIRDGRALPGWLLVTTRYAALNARRAEARRRKHEHAAAMNRSEQTEPATSNEWEAVRPLLDEAVARLKRDDRDAITLRFFKGQRMGDVAAALGISEPAAQKRVGRAVERLRTLLSRAGVSASAEGLSSVLIAHALSTGAAPVHLSAQICRSTIAASTSAAGKGAGWGLLATTARAKVAAALVAMSLITAGVAVPIAYHASTRSADGTNAKPMTFEQAYALAAGENVKIVRPPFIADRARAMKTMQALPPNARTVLYEYDGANIAWKYAVHGGPLDLGGALRQVLGIWPQDTDIPRERFGKPLPGDWVCRAGTSRDERMNDFCREVASIIGNDMVLKLEPLDRETIVVSGKIDFARAKARRPDEMGNQVSFVEQDPPEESHYTVGQTPREMLQILGEMTGRPVVVEAGTEVDQEKQPFFISTFASGDFSRRAEAPDGALIDPILARVAAQTGLTLNRERRTVPTWRLVNAPPVEPQWKTRFRAAYAPQPGQVLKHLAPPFIRERDEFYQATFDASQVREMPEGFDSYVFGWDGKELTWKSAGGTSLNGILNYVVGLWPQDVEIPRALRDRRVPGDWVYLDGSTTEQRAEALSKLLAAEWRRPFALRAQMLEREAIVVRGEYKRVELPASSGFAATHAVHFYRGPAQKNGYGGSGDVRDMLQWLGTMTQRPVVIEATFDPKATVSWYAHESSDFHLANEPPDAAIVNEILGNVQEQTSFRLTLERRTVPIWQSADNPGR